MKTTFTAKYLQHLASKKKQNEGFTLIELLVVIIIVGVLAAIALPSFLNQISKARSSEAKSNLGVINRAQQSYRLEQQTFSTNLPGLDARIDGSIYTYSVVGGQYTTTSQAAAGTNDDIKNYGGGVAQSGDNTVAVVLCESVTVDGGATPAATANPGASATTTATATCSAGVEVD
jgi:type IV pilus assembly protein PilA